MSLTRRLSVFGHSVVTSLVMSVLASSVRRRTLGVSVALILLLEQIVPLALAPLKMPCDPSDLVGQSFTTVQMVLIVLPLWVGQWLAAAFLIILLRNSTYYLPESRLHSCTLCYAIVLFACVTKGSVQLVGYCSSDDTIRRVFRGAASVIYAGYLGAYALQIRLTSLKLRLVAVAAPKLARVGGAFADAVLALMLPIAVVNLWRMNSNSAFAKTILDFASSSAGLCYAIFSGIYCWVMEISAKSAKKEATQVDVDVKSASRLVRAACWTRIAAAVNFAAFLSTICYIIYRGFFWQLSKVMYAANFYVFLLDAVLNLISVALHSGIAFPEVMPADVWASIEVSATSVDAQRRRQIETRLKGDLGNSTGSALTIAALMEGFPPEEILEVGRNSFRCICWDVLTMRPEIILGGSPIDGFGPVEPNLYSLSRSCRLGQCDVFYSHSWHESGQMKWEALKAWCSEFELSYGRKPRIWLDKVCLDQENIDVALRSLPVFLAGCNTLFATSGPTYRSRLWCVMELLVYRMMLVADPGRSPPQVWMLGGDDEECERQRQDWGRFDVRDSKCFHFQDKERFLRVVSMYPGGAEGLNAFIRDLAVDFKKFVLTMPDNTDSYSFTETVCEVSI